MALTTQAHDLVEVLERIHGREGADDDLPWGEALCRGELGAKRERVNAHTECPVQLSQPQYTWWARVSVGESPDPEEDDEEDLGAG